MHCDKFWNVFYIQNIFLWHPISNIYVMDQIMNISYKGQHPSKCYMDPAPMLY